MRVLRMLRAGVAAAMLLTTGCTAAPHPTPPTQEAPVTDATIDLLDAATAGDADAVRVALDEGADIEARGDSGMTALVAATKADHVEAARALIEAGADVNAKDDIQDSAYLYAGARGHDEILLLTLENGADLTSTNRFGGTALIPASERGLLATVEILLDAGVDPDHVNNLNWTALHEAIVLGDGSARYVDVVRALIDGGADVGIPDGDGVLPVDLARTRGYDAIVAELQR
ncbi:ankyrin repeat domain-containing protein [Microbacterium sp. NPDC028030]|uniref:ankyrin repeat domain-containing protein n=1 Tax=Microbacterium sp. NPDC028030 TaxID=3155124 RepID=UPI0033F8B36B